MWTVILGIVAGGISIVLWWLNHTPQRRHDQLLEEIQQLKEDYAQAIATGDGVAAAVCLRRLRELADALDHPAR